MGWNDAIDETTDWADASFLNMFIVAINERQHFSPFDPPPLATLSAGDDASSSLLIKTLQDRVAGLASWFVPASSDPDGLATAPTAYTATTMRTAAGISGGFTRKFPREVSSLSASADTQGQTIADGMKARNLSDGIVYHRQSGQWEATSDPPDTKTATGSATAGDYIGPWIWNELRDCLKLLTVAWVDHSWNSTGKEGDEFAASLAAAQAAAAAEYAGSSLSGSTAPNCVGVLSQTVGNRAILTRWKGNAVLASYHHPTTATVKWYVFAERPSGTGTRTFDDNGDGLSENVWNHWHTDNAAPASLVSTAELGGTAQPAWPSDPFGSQTSLGYRVSQSRALIDLSPGLTYP